MLPHGKLLNWDNVFAKTEKSIIIQNRQPPHSSDQGGRNIFKEDKEEIMKAAKKYNFKIISKKGSKNVEFVKT